MTRTLYILRHGQTQSDLEDRYGGWYEDDLTGAGMAQTEAAIAKLKDLGIERILCSPLRRARQTGDMVGEALKLEVETWEGWKEHNCYGILTGMTKIEAKEKHSDLVDIVHDKVLLLPGKEPYPDFMARLEKALEETVALPEATALVITHGGPIRALCQDILKVGTLKEVADCALLRLSVANGKVSLQYSNGITFA